MDTICTCKTFVVYTDPERFLSCTFFTLQGRQVAKFTRGKAADVVTGQHMLSKLCMSFVFSLLGQCDVVLGLIGLDFIK